MQMRKILCSPSLAFDSALVKYMASELGLFDLNHNCKIYFSGSSTVCSTTAGTVTGTPASRNIPIVGTAAPSGYARSVLPERSLSSSYTADIRNSLSAPASVQEHKRLFNYRSSGNTNTSKKGKRPPTCTLKFMCMAKRDSVKPPTSVKDRTQLANAGLGDTSIQFDLHEGVVHCHQRIVGIFPKLADVGYVLLLFQRGEGGGFCNLAPPYTPKRLKDACGNCKFYIRPLQKDLEVEDISSEELNGIEEEVCRVKLPPREHH